MSSSPMRSVLALALRQVAPLVRDDGSAKNTYPRVLGVWEIGSPPHMRVTADELGRLGGAGLVAVPETHQLDRDCDAVNELSSEFTTLGGGSARRHCGGCNQMREGCANERKFRSTGPDPCTLK